MTVAVRAAGPDDARAVAGLAARAWRAAYADVLTPDVLGSMDPVEGAADRHADPSDPPPAGRVWVLRAAAWPARRRAPPRADRMWVIGPADDVWGFARTGPCTDADAPAGAGEVHGLYLEPTRIGTGLGRGVFGHRVA